jgi:hypothetical protein
VFVVRSLVVGGLASLQMFDVRDTEFAIGDVYMFDVYAFCVGGGVRSRGAWV